MISSCIVRFENYLAQMTIKTRHSILCMNHVATSKVKVTVRTYNLCIGLNETYLCPAHNFVVGPASGMVRYKDLGFHPFVWSHLTQGTRRGISVLWTHFFSSIVLPLSVTFTFNLPEQRSQINICTKLY